MHETGYRTHTCGDLRASDVGATVKLAGWVHRRRDQGGIVFLDLRDRYGMTQVSISKDAVLHTPREPHHKKSLAGLSLFA